MNETISIIIPTLNEKNNIKPLVERLNSALSGYKYEIVFVDDNSRDGTIETAQELSTRYPVKVVVRKDRRGLATAVVDGLKHASGEIIGVMDADLQHPPEVVPALANAIEGGADLAVASRYVKGGGCPGWGLTRRMMSKGAIVIAHILLAPTRAVKDITSGFFMFRKAAVNPTDLKPTGYKILLEVLMVGNFHKITEVPFVFALRDAGKSKLGFRQQSDYMQHVFSLMKRKGELVRFLKFCLVGGSGVLVNFGVYWLLTRPGSMPMYAANIVSFEVSVITNFTLNEYFTFHDRRFGNIGNFIKRLLKFNGVSLVGLGLQQGSLWLFAGVMGINDLVALVIGIAIATLWNYLVNSWWTWK